MLTWRHPLLPPPTKLSTKKNCKKTFSQKLCRGRSRVTLVTHNEGCVRYPTEGNSSSHELTTTMHHLSNTLEGFQIFIRNAVGFLTLVRFFA